MICGDRWRVSRDQPMGSIFRSHLNQPQLSKHDESIHHLQEIHDFVTNIVMSCHFWRNPPMQILQFSQLRPFLHVPCALSGSSGPKRAWGVRCLRPVNVFNNWSGQASMRGALLPWRLTLGINRNHTHTDIHIYICGCTCISIYDESKHILIYTCSLSLCLILFSSVLLLLHVFVWFCSQKNPATSGNSEQLRLRKDLVGIVRVKAIEHLDLEKSHHKTLAILMRKFMESLHPLWWWFDIVTYKTTHV